MTSPRKEQRFFTGTLIVAVFLVATVALWRKHQQGKSEAPEPGREEAAPSTANQSQSPEPAENTASSSPQVDLSVAKPKPAAATRVHTVVSQEPEQPVETVRIPAAKTLAKVNHALITLKDLAPLGQASSNAEKLMSAEMYRALLDRAIERELTFQAARAKGIELTEEQQRQREQVRETLLGQRNDQDGKVAHLNLSGTLETQIEFEMRDATSQLLFNSLLAAAGVPSSYVTEDQVQQYYQTHRDQFSALPDAEAERAGVWQKIDYEIRQKLAPLVQAEYQDQARKFMEQLKAEATVTVIATAD